MPYQKSSDILAELATKTIIAQAALRKLKHTDNKEEYFLLLEESIEDSIYLQHKLQSEINNK